MSAISLILGLGKILWINAKWQKKCFRIRLIEFLVSLSLIEKWQGIIPKHFFSLIFKFDYDAFEF